MFIFEGDELQVLLANEDAFINDLKTRLEALDIKLLSEAEHKIRIGKRIELMCELQIEKKRGK